jgi:mRNA-degrading endonuclease toxin of MazEF toxin-antitoxin module
VDIARGGVYYVDLPGVGDKPALVVSWNAINDGLRSPVVCQITTAERSRTLPTFVPIPAGTAGLAEPSYVLCHEVVTLDVEDFRREVGMLPAPLMLQVDEALRRTFDLP